ncbi:Glu/Leu/Phe/Val dehydrogenase dimerization domain-containing protein [Novosphingobium sp.]|uniref:Glu/Leu/Phe/Val dehydrogenase dimerization domain-containing protein n=1 Tax=Novosphingobium sp. TaxID=1874826 RepID=UPI0038BD098E
MDSLLPDFDAHELIQFVHDRASGLSAIIAIHSTHCGPAAGGVRAGTYVDTAAGVADALRLSRAMSFKNAMAGLPLGGGKAVMLLPDHPAIFGSAKAVSAKTAPVKTGAMVEAFADAVEALGGRYVTAQDAGMTLDDMVAMAGRTRFLSGLPGAIGQPGPWTAKGLVAGIAAAVEWKMGRTSLAGLHVAVQGVGAVGMATARLLVERGARVTLAGRDRAKAQALAASIGADEVPAADIMALPCDVLCSCALGRVIDAQAVTAMQAPIVAGGANNQLASPAEAQALQARGVLFAPDYVVNAGGMMAIGVEYDARQRGIAPDPAQVERLIAAIPDRLRAIWQESVGSGETPGLVADRMAARLIGRA